MSRRATILSVVIAAAVVTATAAVLLRDRGTASTATTVVEQAATTSSTSAPTTTPTTAAILAGAGSPGVSDSLYPRLGNGGYDAQHYLLDVVYDPNEGILSGVSTMTALATQDLAAFNLDMAALLASRVTVDGELATFRQESFELITEPATGISCGATFVVVVEYAGFPERFSTEALPLRIGWFGDGNSVYVMSEPDATSSWFPINDHPLDKATFTVRVGVPPPLTAASNGILVGTVQEGANTVFVFEHDFPMASYLVALGIGELERIESVSDDGVLIRGYIDVKVSGGVRQAFDRQGEMVDFFADLFGPYPFEAYGALLVESGASTFSALET
jgi:aminopeptidase N